MDDRGSIGVLAGSDLFQMLLAEKKRNGMLEAAVRATSTDLVVPLWDGALRASLPQPALPPNASRRTAVVAALEIEANTLE